jgi:two-component system chemotaxis response regulator CheB
MRSAANAYGRRVVGVVLTGNLDDGTAGLAAIRARGGLTVVQDPAEALFPGMPRSAVENATPDHVLAIRDIAPLLGRLATTALHEEDRMPTESGGSSDGRNHVHDEYTEIADGDAPSVYTCPECHGTLWEVHDNGLFAFRCRVGHRYSTETLVAEQEVALEAALWTALRALEESAALSRRLAKRAEEQGQRHAVTRFGEQASDRERRAGVVRAALESGSAAAARGGDEPSSATAAL